MSGVTLLRIAAVLLATLPGVAGCTRVLGPARSTKGASSSPSHLERICMVESKARHADRSRELPGPCHEHRTTTTSSTSRNQKCIFNVGQMVSRPSFGQPSLCTYATFPALCNRPCALARIPVGSWIVASGRCTNTRAIGLLRLRPGAQAAGPRTATRRQTERRLQNLQTLCSNMGNPLKNCRAALPAFWLGACSPSTAIVRQLPLTTAPLLLLRQETLAVSLETAHEKRTAIKKDVLVRRTGAGGWPRQQQNTPCHRWAKQLAVCHAHMCTHVCACSEADRNSNGPVVWRWPA